MILAQKNLSSFFQTWKSDSETTYNAFTASLTIMREMTLYVVALQLILNKIRVKL